MLGAAVKASVAPLPIVQLLLTVNVVPVVVMVLMVVFNGTPVPETPWPTTRPTVLPTVIVVALFVASVVTIELIDPRVPCSAWVGGSISVKLPPMGPIWSRGQI